MCVCVRARVCDYSDINGELHIVLLLVLQIRYKGIKLSQYKTLYLRKHNMNPGEQVRQHPLSRVFQTALSLSFEESAVPGVFRIVCFAVVSALSSCV